MQHIQKISHILSIFFKTLCGLFPILITYFILFHLNQTTLHWLNLCFSTHNEFPIIHAIDQFSWAHRFLLLLIEAIPLSLTSLICYKLAQLFHLYQQGQLFEEKNITLIRSISIYMISGQIVQFIYQPLMTLALSFNNPPGERFIGISLETTNFSTLITGLIILVASWVVKEAHQLKSDAQLTI